jgi:serine/threonine-protein kinase RsbW
MEAICEPAIVDLQLDSAPESVGLVRAGLKGFGTWLDMDSELLEDMQMVASEACNNVVMHAYHEGPGPLAVRVTATHDSVDVLVRDHGDGFDPARQDPDGEGLGLVVIQSLADRSELGAVPGGGTEVRAHFDCALPALIQSEDSEPVAPSEPASIGLPGGVVATVSPVSLLAGVMGRLTRALAAQARFSIDRFGELHTLMDSLAGPVERFARNGRLTCALDVETRRLQLRIGPLRPGRERGDDAELMPRLPQLPGTLEVERRLDAETLCLTLRERRLSPAV